MPERESGAGLGVPAGGGAAGWGIVFGAFRIVAWGALLGATGLLVRAEAERPTLPRGVFGYSDLVYRHDGYRRARLDLYVPAGPATAGGRGRPAVLAIHGGGWRGGSKRPYGRMAAALAEHGYVVAAVDYALSRPSVPSWPANLEDLRAAVRWLRRHADQYGVDPNRIAAMGASAGAHLAMLLGTFPGNRATATADAPADSARIQAVIDFYGPSDLAALAATSRGARPSLSLYLGGTPQQVPDRYAAASPIRHLTPEAPPMLLIHGMDDRLVPPEQSRLLDRALAEAGVPHRLIIVPGARHGFGFRVDSADLLPEILAFLQTAWNVHPRAGDRGIARLGDFSFPRAATDRSASEIPHHRGAWRPNEIETSMVPELLDCLSPAAWRSRHGFAAWHDRGRGSLRLRARVEASGRKLRPLMLAFLRAVWQG